jgi:hypothetical protein
MINHTRLYYKSGMLLSAAVCVLLFSTSSFAVQILKSSRSEFIRQGQSVKAKVDLFSDGSIIAAMTLTNGAEVEGLCGVAYFAIEDKKGTILEVHKIPKACVGKAVSKEEPFVKEIPWKGKVENKQTLKETAAIVIKCYDSDMDPAKLIGVKIQSIKDIFK